MSDTQPERVGPYQIEDRLGEGGMGTVYRALDTRLNRLVAIKFLASDRADVAALRVESEIAKLPRAHNRCTRRDAWAIGRCLRVLARTDSAEPVPDTAAVGGRVALGDPVTRRGPVPGNVGSPGLEAGVESAVTRSGDGQ
jgi:hypothetical protein